MQGKFTPTKVESNVFLTFNQKTIQDAILSDLRDQGYDIKGKAWSEDNKRFEVNALRPEAKQKGGK